MFAASENASLFSYEQAIAAKLLNAFKIKKDATQVGSVIYGTDGRLAFRLNQYDNENAVSKAIKNLQNPRFGSAIDKGLNTVADKLFIKSNGARPTVPKVLVTFVVKKISPFNDKLNALTDVKIIPIGVGPDADKEDLTNLGSNKEKIFNIPSEIDLDGEEISELIKNVIDNARQGMLVLTNWKIFRTTVSI